MRAKASAVHDMLSVVDEGTRGFPADKIVCKGRYLRYVVACMHNCTERHHCPDFWDFFKARGITPAQYLNKDGIGESVMKRIVFDCDRCGKKDVGEPYSIFHVAGPDEGKRLELTAFHEVVLKAGGAACPERFLYGVLVLAYEDRGWEHLCLSCFKKVSGLAAAILGNVAKKQSVAVESARTPTAEALIKKASSTEPKGVGEQGRKGQRTRK